MRDINIDRLMNEAKSRTGLSDFGNDHFMEGLEQFVEGINNRADFIDETKEPLEENFIIRPLINLLHCAKDIADNPEILDQKLLPPITIATLPRAGSSYLQRILAVTGGFQTIPLWQIYMPSRIPGLPDGGKEERRNTTGKILAWMLGQSPHQMQGHPMEIDVPDEEIFIIENVFRSIYIEMQHDSEEYKTWINSTDMNPAYDYLYQQLQYLQWQFHRDNPKPFVLKAPGHLGYIDQLERVFPKEQRIVMSHRDPVESVASNCFLMELGYAHYYRGRADDENYGEWILSWLLKGMDRHLQWRDSHSDIAVLDISFADLCNDSIGTAEKVYDFVGEELTGDGKEKIHEWDRDNPRYKHGKASYSLEKYGLTQARINEAFAPYLDRFSQYIW